MTSPLINVMTAAVLKAGKGLLRDFGEVDQLQISKKGTANFVTASDIRTEKLLQRELSKARPGYGFLMEEGGEVKGADAQYRWIIDPLDGTNNFIHAIPYFCVSVGLEKLDASGRSEIVAGMIFDPIHNDLFTVEKGQGAFLNGRKLVASNRERLEDAMLVGATPSGLSGVGCISRNFGAAALDLAYVAAGRIDACWHYSIKPWDIAAGLLLVREAGGMVTDCAGNMADINAPTLLAANRHLHAPVQALIAKSAKS